MQLRILKRKDGTEVLQELVWEECKEVPIPQYLQTGNLIAGAPQQEPRPTTYETIQHWADVSLVEE